MQKRKTCPVIVNKKNRETNFITTFLLLILIIGFIFLQPILAQNGPLPVILTDEQTKYPLGSHLEYLEDVGDPATGLPIGATGENLKAAIAGETHEYTDMYPGMAKTARDEGFDEIADWFETLAKAERSHANRFQKALDSLEG